MVIERLTIDNFKCFQHEELEFDPTFNIIIGINGTGKSSILEALRIAIGSLFLGVDKEKEKIYSPGISLDDVRLSNYEYQYPVSVSANGTILNQNIQWQRSLVSHNGRTLTKDAKEIQRASSRVQDAVRNNEDVTIPIVAYYSTDRYKKERKDFGVEPQGSRLRGYYNALDTSTNIKFFLDLYYTETLWQLQHGEESPALQAVNHAIMECVECEKVMFDIKKNELYLYQSGKESLPFHLLSDGVRSMLAMVMELALRCYLLNPHLGVSAAQQTNGVVLIDEIDLHLHPSWQRNVVQQLHRAFPHIQFIVTTHAPLVLSSLERGKIISIENNTTYDFDLQYHRDANYILQEMGVDEFDVSEKQDLERYMLMIEGGQGRAEEALALRARLESMLGADHPQIKKADLMLNFF